MILQDKILKQAGDYKVIKSLAASSFSNVYRVKHLLTNKEYALKAIKNPNNKFRIENEVKVTKQLNHLDETLTMQEVFYDEKKLFFVYDLAEQGSLKKYVQSKTRLEEQEALEIFRSLLHTLKLIHNLGVIHQDIKPENIVIKDNKYYFCDFGLSTLNQKHIDIVHLKTDIRFAAPEVYHGFYDKRTDIYALGCVLYYLCTGVNVFDIDSKQSSAYIMLAHSKLNLDFTKVKSKKIQYLLKRMLDKNYMQRASIPELEYILLNNYNDLNILQTPLDYAPEQNRSEQAIYEELSSDNIPFAQNALAIFYAKQNPQQAFELYFNSAQNGLLKAYFNLGLCYKDAIGCSKNMQKAFECFSKAAIHHHENATYMVGLFYEYGIYVKQDLQKAYQLYKSAAYHGQKKAYEKLKSMKFLSESKQKVNYNSNS